MKGLPERPVSRIAPTPSGFLHLGNAVNFLVTWVLVRSLNGRLHLRIDDMDGIRLRTDVLEDIFVSLDWLGLDWDEGPDGPDSFFKKFSLQLRKADYWERLHGLQARSGRAFVCDCSRSAIKKTSKTGLYPGTCRDKGLTFVPEQNTIRLKVPANSRIGIGGREVELSSTFGDFILWRRDNQPSYQLASLVEDDSAGMSLIVRGEDLFFSTAAQLYLADCFDYTGFPACCFIHHGLITGADGEKLSKSRGAYALKDLRESGMGPEPAVREAAKILGLDRDQAATADELLDGFLGMASD